MSELEQAGEEALVLWDECVLEKPASIQLEGLCAVRSSKARRRVSHQTWLLHKSELACESPRLLKW